MKNFNKEERKILKFLEKQTDYTSQSVIGCETGIEDQDTCHHRDWTIKTLLNDLKQKGCVERTSNPKRKNGSEWKITQKGRKEVNENA